MKTGQCRCVATSRHYPADQSDTRSPDTSIPIRRVGVLLNNSGLYYWYDYTIPTLRQHCEQLNKPLHEIHQPTPMVGVSKFYLGELCTSRPTVQLSGRPPQASASPTRGANKSSHFGTLLSMSVYPPNKTKIQILHLAKNRTNGYNKSTRWLQPSGA